MAMQFERFAFAKKGLSLVLGFLLMLWLTGCGESQDDIYSKVMEEMASSDVKSDTELEEDQTGDDLSGTLTISMYHLYETTGVKPLAEDFMALHPNVTIVLEEGLDDQALQDPTGASIRNVCTTACNFHYEWRRT